MRTSTSRRARLVVGIATLVGLVAACGDNESSTDTTVATTAAAPSPFEGALVGTFAIDATLCTNGVFIGSYVKMVEPGGTVDTGPYVVNADSACDDRSVTAIAAGTDGGFVTGAFQPPPDPAFDAAGNGLASAIFAPVVFSGTVLAGATDPTGRTPTITGTNGVLSGDLSAFTLYVDGGSFDQGAPVADGSGVGPVGLIQLVTGRYVLDWSSPIIGGPFDGATGVWHLEGTFEPS